jgi:phenylacetate-CoA ligase
VIVGGVERALQLARGSTGKHVRELRDGQWLAPVASRADHERRLSALLEHAARHVPYYREVLTASGAWQAPGHVALERFEDVPLLDKTTIRSRFDDLKSDDLSERDWYYNATGGSTGEPMKLVQDRAFTDWERAMRLSIDTFIGRKPGEKRLVIWGSATDLEKGRESLRARLGQRMRGEATLNSFRLSPELLPQYVDFMNDYRPLHVIGYVESLEVLARFIERNGLRVHSPRTITTAAGTLHPHTRGLLSKVFRSEVFDHYGTREVVWIATECGRHEGLHVALQSVHLEVLREDGIPASPGEVGRIVVTSLVNYAMPLIRYVIGDLGAWAEAPCSCERAWPLLREVTGRISDTFVKADGTLVAGQYWNYIAFMQDWVQQFQVVQEAIDQLRVLIVVRDAVSDLDEKKAAGMQEIRRLVDVAMGTDCAVSFEFVDFIEPTPSGKFRFTVSKVHEDGV